MSWASLAPLPFAGPCHGSVFGSLIYVENAHNGLMWSYDPATNTYTQRASRAYTSTGVVAGETATTISVHSSSHVNHWSASTSGSARARFNKSTNAWDTPAAFPGGAARRPMGGGAAGQVTVTGGVWFSLSKDSNRMYKWDDSTAAYTDLGLRDTLYYDNDRVVIIPVGGSTATLLVADTHGTAGFGEFFLDRFTLSNNSFTSDATKFGILAAYFPESVWHPGKAKHINPIMTDNSNTLYASDVLTNAVRSPRSAGPLSGHKKDVRFRARVHFNGFLYFFGGVNTASSTNLSSVDRFNPDMPLPTSVSPVHNATVNTDIPTVAGTITSSGEWAVMQWQAAVDTGFTTNLRDLLQSEASTGPWKMSGATSEIMQGALELFQGVWYLRARQRNGINEVSPWVATQTFTVTHVPSASPVSPSGDQTLNYGTSGTVQFEWTFSDPSPTDFQTAWQIICERNDTGAVIFDTGKVASQNARTYTYNFAATAKDLQLRWKIRVWDSDDVPATFSNYALFRVSDLPAVNIDRPLEGSTTSSSKPTVSWTFSASGGRTQSSWRVRFIQGGGVIHDTGVTPGAAATYTPPDAVLGAGAFQVRVDVVDNTSLANFDTNSFNVDFSPPLASNNFSLSDANYEESGYIRVSWTNADKDAEWQAWKIRRRLAGSTGPAELLYETRTDAANYTFDDYAAASNVTYEYFLVQVALRGGVEAESSLTNGKLIQGTSTKYWLVHKTDSSKNILLHHVSADDFSDDYESETLELIGRGRKVDYGTHFGYKGSLSAKLFNRPNGVTARQQRMQLEDLKRRRESIYLRTPFGDVFLVNLGNIAFSRVAGVALHEALEVTIPYEEIR